MMRVTGSLAFVAAGRAAFLVAKNKENEARRLFLPLKVNYGDDHRGLAYEIRSAQLDSPAGVIETSLVEWDSEPVTVTADEIMIPEERVRGAECDRRDSRMVARVSQRRRREG
jgi:hypothetical protein